MNSFLKNTLISSSLTLGLSCAAVLASSPDSSGDNSLGADARQQAGQTAHTSPRSGASDLPKGDVSSGVSTTNPGDSTLGDPNKTLGQDHWATATLCTDSGGLSYRRGTRGFERCVAGKRGGPNSQAGQVGSEQKDSGNPLNDTSNPGRNENPPGSDSSGAGNPSGIGGASSGLGAGSNTQ